MYLIYKLGAPVHRMYPAAPGVDSQYGPSSSTPQKARTKSTLEINISGWVFQRKFVGFVLVWVFDLA